MKFPVGILSIIILIIAQVTHAQNNKAVCSNCRTQLGEDSSESKGFVCYGANENLPDHLNKLRGSYGYSESDKSTETGTNNSSVQQQNTINLTKWKMVWNDEFDCKDKKLDKNWEAQNGPSGHILCSRWRENVVVRDGILELIAKKEKRGGQDWTAGSIWTKKKFKYGYFECRYKYAGADATNNSFWLMTREDPKVGKRFEIDINEGHFPKTITTNIHNHTDHIIKNGKKTSIRNPEAFDLSEKYEKDFASEFHTYGLEWNKEEMVFYFDGKEIRRVKNEFCFRETPIWLSLALVQWYGKLTDAADGKSMKVDYVRYYQKK